MVVNLLVTLMLVCWLIWLCVGGVPKMNIQKKITKKYTALAHNHNHLTGGFKTL